ncbi:MAG: hypothetical protein ACI364_02835 [Coriobacteriales bacterium]
MWRGERQDEASWTRRDYDVAAILDYLQVINLRLAHVPPDRYFTPMERPGDRRKARERSERRHAVSRRIEETEWEEA